MPIGSVIQQQQQLHFTNLGLLFGNGKG